MSEVREPSWPLVRVGRPGRLAVPTLAGRLAVPTLAGLLALVLGAVLAVPRPTYAQASGDTDVERRAVRVDTAGLGSGPYSRMHMLLEKTLFQVDVLTLELRFGPETTARLEELLAGDRGDRGDRPGGATAGVPARPVPDSVAALALSAGQALATLEFRRDVGLRRFLEGIRSSLRKAADAGLIDEYDFETIAAALPGWYGFLAERGIRAGDRMHQRIRGDSLRTVYFGTRGDLLLDQLDVGPERRLSVLGGYLAPGSDFRDGLIASLPGAD